MVLGYYPFGLKHNGYNNVVSSNGNSTAQKFKYNGVELEESLGLNLYEMEFRQYDPAIARFTSIDPVTHHSMSTYTAFDNNPVFWADPSGANATMRVQDLEGNWHTLTEGVDYTTIYSADDGDDDSNNSSTDPDPKKKETRAQRIFRQLATKFVVGLDNQNNMKLSDPANDKNVTAYQLFYQWIMGAGTSTRNFDEGSIMGQQMLKAPEIIAAIKKAAEKARGGDMSNTRFFRSLSQENPLEYVKDFFTDIDGRNPARGFHGSFAGNVVVNSVFSESNVTLVNLTIIMTDNMTATSGTRSSPLAGGYGKNPVAIYPQENPYGPRGQFRTIKVSYKMNVTVQEGVQD